MNSRLILAAVCTIFFTLTLAAAPSPWDSWRSGYTTFEQAESLRERGHYTEALSRYERAKKSYLAVRSARPDWNQQVISDRIGECDRKIGEVRKLLKNGRQSGAAPVEKPQEKTSVNTTAVSTTAAAPASTETEAETDYYGYESREVKELKAEKKQLLGKIAAADKVISELRKTALRQQNLEREISNLMRDRRVAQEKYLLLEQRCKNLELDLAKPDTKLQELQKRLVEERLNAEKAAKQAELAREENRKNENAAKENRLLRSAMEKKLLQSEEDQKKLRKEFKLLEEKNAETGKKNLELQEKLNAAERRAAALTADAAENARRERQAAQENAAKLSRDAETEQQKLLKDLAAIKASGADADAREKALTLRLASAEKQLADTSRTAAEEKKHADAELALARKSIEERDLRLAERKKEAEGLALQLKKQELLLQQERDAEKRRTGDTAKFRLAAENAAAENKRLSERNTVLERDVRELSDRAAQLKKRLETRDSEDFRAAAAARETNRKQEKDLLALQHELVELRNSVYSLSSRNQDLERKMKGDAAETLSARNQAIAAAARLESAEKELKELREINGKYTELQRNFEALTAENRENRALAAAAKPQEAELAKIKLRLLEMERLKGDLAKEQRLNEEMQGEYRKLTAEARQLRSRSSELTAARRRIAELEAAEKELQRLKKIQVEYEKLAGRDQELAALKITAGETESQLLICRAQLKNSTQRLSDSEKLLADARRENQALPLLRSRNAELAELVRTQTEELKRNSLNLENSRKQTASLRLELQNNAQKYAEEKRIADENHAAELLKNAAKYAEEKRIADENHAAELRKNAAKYAEEKRIADENHAAELRKNAAKYAEEMRAAQTGSAAAPIPGQTAVAAQKMDDEVSERLKTAARQLAEVTNKFNDSSRQLAEITKKSDESSRQLTDARLKLSENARLLADANKKFGETRRQLELMTEKYNETARNLVQNEQKSAEQSREVAVLRAAAAKLTPLNDQLSRERRENLSVKSDLEERIGKLERRVSAAETMLSSRDQELAKVRKLNKELADLNKAGSSALRAEADKAEKERLVEEVRSLRQLNVDLSAERDRIAAELANRDRGIHPMESTVKVSGSPEELAAAGLAAETGGSIELALWNYRQAVEANPDFTPAHLRIGLLLLARGDYKGALPHLSAARSAKPQDLDLALKTARCQIALKRFGNARAVVDPLLKTHPENYRVQLLSGMIDAASGMNSRAEERMITAARLAPKVAECQLELARLLTNQISDRSGEAVDAYEKARMLGAPPDPALEKSLGTLLDRRRELIRFLSGAAGEAELGNDWKSAIWYYKKLLEMKRQEFAPRLALAQLRGGSAAAARETLEFNAPSRLGMAVRTLIEAEKGNETEALRAVRQVSGGAVPADWIGMKMELEKLAAKTHPSAAERMLLITLAPKQAAQ